MMLLRQVPRSGSCAARSEEHTSELQSHSEISYAVFCLKKKKQRSIQEHAALNYFDPEQLDVNPVPNPANGTVDIEYKVVEQHSDQIEASGGFGGGFGFVGSVGLSLNNFSTRKMFQKGGWNPIPTGDGQRLTVRAQSNGIPFQSYNFSFTEPWLGGKKPNSLTASVFYSRQTSQVNWTDRNDPNRQRLHT